MLTKYHIIHIAAVSNMRFLPMDVKKLVSIALKKLFYHGNGVTLCVYFCVLEEKYYLVGLRCMRTFCFRCDVRYRVSVYV